MTTERSKSLYSTIVREEPERPAPPVPGEFWVNQVGDRLRVIHVKDNRMVVCTHAGPRAYGGKCEIGMAEFDGVRLRPQFPKARR